MLYLGADHNGYKIKESLKEYFDKQKIAYKDLGNKKFNSKDDYPDFAKKVAKKVSKEKDALGILICGSGQGMCITANKFKNVRAALGWSVASTRKSRHDDDANIICIPGWRFSQAKALRLVKTFLQTPFSKIPRHKRRIKKIKV